MLILLTIEIILIKTNFNNFHDILRDIQVSNVSMDQTIVFS